VTFGPLRGQRPVTERPDRRRHGCRRRLRECRHWRTGLDGDFFVFEGRLDDLARPRIDVIWESGVAALEDGDVRPEPAASIWAYASRRRADDALTPSIQIRPPMASASHVTRASPSPGACLLSVNVRGNRRPGRDDRTPYEMVFGG